jgi:PKD repeat protein
LANASVVVSNCVFAHNSVGLYAEAGAELDLVNNVFHKNSLQGVYAPEPVSIMRFRNNLATANGTGVSLSDASVQQWGYNGFSGNGADVRGASLAGSDLRSEPLYVDAAAINFHLQESSLYREAGDPDSAYADLDGSRNDIGADGGPHGVQDVDSPYVALSASRTEGGVPLRTVFDASEATDEWGIAAYMWSIGGEVVETHEPTIEHVFETAGTHSVVLTVRDHSGLTSSTTVEVTVLSREEALADSDGDGITDGQEALLGSDPLDAASGPDQGLVVPFFLDSAPATGSFPPVAGMQAFLGVKNMADYPVTCSVRYFSPDGVESTPLENSFTLQAQQGVSWRPAVYEPAVEALEPPDMAGSHQAGSAIITATGPISGRVINMQPGGNQSAYLMGPVSDNRTLVVPFFLDNAPADGSYPPSSGIQTFVGVQNLSSSPATVTLQYADGNGEDCTPSQNTFTLEPYAGLGWRPGVNDPGVESAHVPDIANGAQAGSIVITADAPIAGRVVTLAPDGLQSAYELSNGADCLAAPAFDDDDSHHLQSYISLKNLNEAPSDVNISYFGPALESLTGSHNYTVAGLSSVAWRPYAHAPEVEAADVPNASTAYGSAIFESAGSSLAGRVIEINTNSQWAYSLPRVAAQAGPSAQAVPFFLDDAVCPEGSEAPESGILASYITVRNVEDFPIVVVLEYKSGDGQDRTPAQNALMLEAHEIVKWRPAGDDPRVPTMTEGVSGSLSLTSQDGRFVGLLTTVMTGDKRSSYTFAGGSAH